jgi:hypothetical protein
MVNADDYLKRQKERSEFVAQFKFQSVLFAHDSYRECQKKTCPNQRTGFKRLATLIYLITNFLYSVKDRPMTLTR